MSTVDLIEFLGVLVDAGELGHDEAVARIVAHSESGLTPYGAADLLRTHRTVRRRYLSVAEAVVEAHERLWGAP